MAAKASSSETSFQSTASDSMTAQSEKLPPIEDHTAEPVPGFGWTRYAEQINGRFAMVGFVLLLLLELFTRQDFFTWIGLR